MRRGDQRELHVSRSVRPYRETSGASPLPATVIEVYPAWRGYEFILVEDEILIIDPATLRIVAILEA